MTNTRKILFLILLPLLAACVSKNHLGVNQYENGNVFCRTINTKTAKAAKGFEEEIIRIITSNQMEELNKNMSAKFSKNLTIQDREKISAAIKSHEFDGSFETSNFVGQPISLDEAISWDGFEKYHFLVSAYRLKGKEDAYLYIEFRKYDDGIRLVGLGLMNVNKSSNNDSNSFKYRFLDNMPADNSVPKGCGMLFR